MKTIWRRKKNGQKEMVDEDKGRMTSDEDKLEKKNNRQKGLICEDKGRKTKDEDKFERRKGWIRRIDR